MTVWLSMPQLETQQRLEALALQAPSFMTMHKSMQHVNTLQSRNLQPCCPKMLQLTAVITALMMMTISSRCSSSCRALLQEDQVEQVV